MVLAVLGTAGVVRAEEPVKAPEVHNTAGAKDIVRLKNGGILQGTIAELVPDESVTIVTIAGATRSFPMADVAYAGPIDREPQSPAATNAPEPAPAVPEPTARATTEMKPYVTVNAREARLHLQSVPDKVTFHRLAASAGAFAGFERMCTAPCDVTMPAGTETLALSHEDGGLLAADPITLPAGSTTLYGKVHSRQSVRTGGIVITVIGSLVTLGAAIAFPDASRRDSDLVLYGGIGGGMAAAGVGVLMMLVRDKATIGTTPSEKEEEEAEEEARVPLPVPIGLSYRGHL